MTLKFLNGYWTIILANGQAIMSFPTRAAAQALLDECADLQVAA